MSERLEVKVKECVDNQRYNYLLRCPYQTLRNTCPYYTRIKYTSEGPNMIDTKGSCSKM